MREGLTDDLQRGRISIGTGMFPGPSLYKGLAFAAFKSEGIYDGKSV